LLSISTRWATGARLTASRNRRTEKRSGDHARRVGAVLAGDVERRTVIRRGPRKRQSERNVHRAAERRDLDRRHTHIVIGRDHRVEFAAHGANEHGIGGKWSGDSCFRGRGGEQRCVFLAEPSGVSRVGIERAERDSRLGDSEPLPQAVASDASSVRYRLGRQPARHLAQRQVGRGEYHPQLVRRQHHRDARAGELRQHLGVTRKIVATGEERCLVDRRGDDPIDFAGRSELHCALDGEAAESSGVGGGARL